MTPSRFLELCTEWNVKFIPIKSTWTKNNRNHKGPFGDMNGVMIHHTGTDMAVSDQCSLLYNGYSALPGPLCHSGIDPAGILRLAGWGRANHAGLGDPNVFAKVKGENYSGILKPKVAEVDGNAHFYGFEIMYSGSHEMSDAQRITAVRVAALICREHDWKAESVIGHGEWQPGKWDPGVSKGKMADMARFRDEVRQAIQEGPPKKLPPRPPSNTKTYTVQKGDTLYGIAKKHSTTVTDLVNWNPDIIQPGMKLTIKK